MADALRAVTADIAARHPESHVVRTITDVTGPNACDALIAVESGLGRRGPEMIAKLAAKEMARLYA